MINEISDKLKNKGLKVTPQRIAILEAIYKLEGHPTADNIIEYIRKTNPSIATGTVYKVLDVLVEHGLIAKVKTDKDIMRYDGFTGKHHHLYCSASDRIEDYMDEELDGILGAYFEKKKIPDFKISDIKLEIKGRFLR
jgi:Fur family peroxide stress response transcriptional regulator